MGGTARKNLGSQYQPLFEGLSDAHHLLVGWDQLSSDGFCSVVFIGCKKRLCDSKKVLDKRCCAYQRCKEATEKATAHLENMVKRVLAAGVSAKYLLMDSWFTMPAAVATLAQHIKIIGMVKKSPKIHYAFNGQSLDLMDNV